jgi:hypothetical protein
VLALAQVQMAPQQGQRLAQFLAKQGEATLTVQEQADSSSGSGSLRPLPRQSAAACVRR